MSKLHYLFDALIGLRKLLFSIGAIVLIATGMGVITILFLLNLYLGHKYNFHIFVDGETLSAVYTSGFTYIAAVAGAYLAINVANKWVHKWIAKKPRR